MDAPVIGTNKELTLEQAKAEFIELVAHLKNKPKFGWVRGIQTRIDDRLDYLRITITNFICEI